MRRLSNRLTYANVVATIALFAALSTGGAYAASQLGKNSVGPKAIQKGAVGSRALKNASVSRRDLAERVRSGLHDIERANVKSDGTIAGGTAVSGNLLAPNNYTVQFERDITQCSFSATPVSVSGDAVSEPAAGAHVTGAGTGSDGGGVTVTTYDAVGSPVPSGFHLIVVC